MWAAFMRSRPPSAAFDFVPMLAEVMRYFDHTVQRAYLTHTNGAGGRYSGVLLHIFVDNIDRALFSPTLIHTLLHLPSVGGLHMSMSCCCNQYGNMCV